MLICDVLDKNAAVRPRKNAIVCGGKAYTFACLRERTDRLAALLDSLGIRRGDTVGILLPNCAEYYESFLAPLRIAALSVPLHPCSSLPDLESIFKDCTITALIMGDENFEEVREIIRKLPHVKCMLINYRHGPLFVPALRENGFHPLFSGPDILRAGKKTPVPVRKSVEEDETAVYVYTSGTTDKPKGVILTHGIIARRGANRRNLVMGEEDRCYTLGGLYHNGKLFIGLVWSLYLGMTFYTDPEFHPLRTLDRLHYDQITFFHASPFHFGILAFWEGFGEIPPLPRLHTCLSSGNRLDPEIKEAFEKRFGASIRENYGITEAGGLCTDGFPHPGVTVRIQDPRGKEMGKNQTGEIVVRGAGMSRGYLNRPEQTAEKFRDGYYYTGDVGMMDEQGKLHIFSRKNNALSPSPWQEAIQKNRFDLFRP